MKPITMFLAASTIGMLSMLGSTVKAQPRAQADLHVSEMRVRPSGTQENVYDVEVGVYVDNDDDAYDTLLYVFLPPESHAVDLSAGCSAPSSGPGYVVCSLGQLSIHQPMTPTVVSFTASVPPTFILPRFGAFVLSTSSEPDLSSNLHQLIADRAIVREESHAEVYVIVGHAKFWVPDETTLTRMYGGWANVVTVPDGTLSTYDDVPDDGTYLREENDARVWKIEGTQKRWVSSPDCLPSGRWAWVGVVPDGSLASITENSSSITCP